MTKAPQAEPQSKFCSCGCGEVFRPTRPWHKFIDPSHRKRAWQKKLDYESRREFTKEDLTRIRQMTIDDFIAWMEHGGAV